MRVLEGEEAADAEKYCSLAARLALNSKCQKARHGAVLVNDRTIIGRGWNTPAGYEPCDPCLRKDIKGHTLLEICNSLHAEHEAKDDALDRHGKESLKGAVMYHAMIDWDGNIKKAEGPKCTSCSRMLKHKGLAGFVLFQEQGYVFYDIEEFNRLSYEYHDNKA